MTSAVQEEEFWNKLNLARQGGGLATEVGAGLALDAKTQWMLGAGPIGWAGYILANAAGGATANIAAQKLRGEEEINWGEVISSGALGIIPFTSLRFGKKATKLLGRPGTFKRAALGGAGMGAGDRFIQSGYNEGELPSAGEVATGALAGGAFGGGFQQAGKFVVTKHLKKQIEKAQDEGRVEDLKRLVFNYQKAQNRQPELDKFVSYEQYVQANTIQSTRVSNIFGQLKDASNSHTTKIWTDPITNKQHDIEGISDSTVGTKLTDWSMREASDVASIQGLRAAGKSWEEIYTEYPDLSRRWIGTVPLHDSRTPNGKLQKGLISIAEDNDIPFSKVYEYKIGQVEHVKNLELLTNAFNILDNDLLQVEATYVLRKAVNEGLIAPSVVNEYNQIINKAKRGGGYKFHSVGHLQSLKEMWDKGLRGGDRSTNLMSEPYLNFLAETEPGIWKQLKGNAARQNREDWQPYTLERLTNWNTDLEEDFVKFAYPELGLIGDLQESGLSRRVAVEFQAAAALQFNTLRSEIIDHVNKMKIQSKAKKSKLIKEYERALTTAIADFYIENAQLISESGLSNAKLKVLITAPDTGIIPRFEAQISNLGSEYQNILNNSDLNNPKALFKFIRLLSRLTKKDK